MATTNASADAAEQLAAGAVMPPDCDAETAAAAPAVRQPARFAHNLPVQLTSFIARDIEVTHVRALLAVNRLVTLTFCRPYLPA